MSVYARQAHQSRWPELGGRLQSFGADLAGRRASAFALVMFVALVAFELFNYSTTEFALTDLLGGLDLAGMRWATILALAFCGMDLAGIAWMFSPKPGARRALDSWYLLAAWFLAATMNAMLTWWSVSLALVSHESLGVVLLGQQALLQRAPAFIAILVWLLRILLIGSFTLKGLPQREDQPTSPRSTAAAPPPQAGRVAARLVPSGASAASRRTASASRLAAAPRPNRSAR